LGIAATVSELADALKTILIYLKPYLNVSLSVQIALGLSIR